MKNVKRIVAVMLAVILCIGAFGTVGVSALTEDAAVADAAAYNAVERDYSEIMGNVSEKRATAYANKINDSLVQMFSDADLKSKIYSNETATAIMKALAGLLNTTISNSMKSSTIQENYPEAYEYLFVTCKGSWDAVDNSKVNWGITPGDRDAFAKAVGAGSSNIGTVIIFAGAMGAWLGQPDAYSNAIAPLVESLHVGPMEEFKTAMARGDAGIVEYVVSLLCDAIDNFIAAPVDFVTDVLPDFARTYPAAITVVENLLKALGVGGAIKLPDFNGLVAAIGGNFGLTLTEIDVDALAGMGVATISASAAPGGFRTRINGSKPVVFMAIVKYVKENLAIKENQYAIGRIVVDKTGYASLETYDEMINAARDDNDAQFLLKMFDLVDEMSNNISEAAGTSKIVRVLMKIVNVIARTNRTVLNFILKIFKIPAYL